jgi:hypothetical protein
VWLLFSITVVVGTLLLFLLQFALGSAINRGALDRARATFLYRQISVVLIIASIGSLYALTISDDADGLASLIPEPAHAVRIVTSLILAGLALLFAITRYRSAPKIFGAGG